MMSNAADLPSTDPSMLRMLGDPAIAPQVWGAFLDRYKPEILEWCHQRGSQPDDAEEICSRVIEKLLAEFQTFQYDPARSFQGFLRTVVENTLTSDLRERQRKPGNWGTGGTSTHEPAVEIKTIAEEIEKQATELMRVIDQATAIVQKRTKPQTWDCFWKQVYEGLSGVETAKATGVPLANVYIYKKRVLKRLRNEAAKLWSKTQGHGP
ncbi:MAG: sigma-70 family RNA polymerase sigma factor [Planctomycetaceae bacterium]|nr:MAG: sigma-70 family RNA polymerase sigma factor [Planctomycetaceae bacterium]